MTEWLCLLTMAMLKTKPQQCNRSLMISSRSAGIVWASSRFAPFGHHPAVFAMAMCKRQVMASAFLLWVSVQTLVSVLKHEHVLHDTPLYAFFEPKTARSNWLSNSTVKPSPMIIGVTSAVC